MKMLPNYHHLQNVERHDNIWMWFLKMQVLCWGLIWCTANNIHKASMPPSTHTQKCNWEFKIPYKRNWYRILIGGNHIVLASHFFKTAFLFVYVVKQTMHHVCATSTFVFLCSECRATHASSHVFWGVGVYNIERVLTKFISLLTVYFYCLL